MALIVTFTMLGDQVLARAISRFGEGIDDFSVVWGQIRDSFYKIEAEQFKTMGVRGGAIWPPLSIKYAKWKGRHYPGLPLLQLTGKLVGQFSGNGTMLEGISPMRMVLVTTLKYAIWHQHGTARMPQRKVVSLMEADKMGWIKMLQKFVVDQAKEAKVK